MEKKKKNRRRGRKKRCVVSVTVSDCELKTVANVPGNHHMTVNKRKGMCGDPKPNTSRHEKKINNKLIMKGSSRGIIMIFPSGSSGKKGWWKAGVGRIRSSEYPDLVS